jgi:L-ribulose-5-phosphate 3-epimerase
MRFQNRLAGNTNSYHSYGLNQALEGIAEAGFKYVELSAVRGWTEHVPLDADSEALGRIREALEVNRLDPVSLGGHSDLSTREGMQRGLKALDLCERLGIGIMITAAGHEGGGDSFLANIRRLADRAAVNNIMLAIEVAGDMAPTGAAAANVVERVERSNVFVNYDTANVEYYGGVRAVDDLPEIVGRLGHVHLKDKRGGKGVWDFPAIGEGHVDFPAVLEILANGGFTGPMSVEVEFLNDPWPPLADVHRAMRSSYERLSLFGLS